MPPSHDDLTITIKSVGCYTLDKKSLTHLPPGQNGRYFTDDIFRCFFLNEKFCILIKISLKFVPKDPIENNPTLVQIMAWRWISISLFGRCRSKVDFFLRKDKEAHSTLVTANIFTQQYQDFFPCSHTTHAIPASTYCYGVISWLRDHYTTQPSTHKMTPEDLYMSYMFRGQVIWLKTSMDNISSTNLLFVQLVIKGQKEMIKALHWGPVMLKGTYGIW